MIEEEKEQLTRVYNIYEVLAWHEEKLQAEGWEKLDEQSGFDAGVLYEHARDGYVILAPPYRLVYTPRQ